MLYWCYKTNIKEKHGNGLGGKTREIKPERTSNRRRHFCYSGSRAFNKECEKAKPAHIIHITKFFKIKK